MLQIIATSALTFLCLAAVGFSAVSLNIALRVQKVSPAELAALIHTLQSDLNELYDRVDHWQRRDRVRTLRESKVPVEQPMPPVGSPEYKQMLRARIANQGRTQ